MKMCTCLIMSSPLFCANSLDAFYKEETARNKQIFNPLQMASLFRETQVGYKSRREANSGQYFRNKHACTALMEAVHYSVPLTDF